MTSLFSGLYQEDKDSFSAWLVICLLSRLMIYITVLLAFYLNQICWRPEQRDTTMFLFHLTDL